MNQTGEAPPCGFLDKLITYEGRVVRAVHL